MQRRTRHACGALLSMALVFMLGAAARAETLGEAIRAKQPDVFAQLAARYATSTIDRAARLAVELAANPRWDAEIVRFPDATARRQMNSDEIVVTSTHQRGQTRRFFRELVSGAVRHLQTWVYYGQRHDPSRIYSPTGRRLYLPLKRR